MKKILLSVFTIGVVVFLAVGATRAYFSDSEVVTGNTFATGTVTLGDVSSMPVTVTNLAPGVSVTKTVGFQYTGTINADVYLGNRGNPAFPADDYLANVLKVKITAHADPATVYFNNYANVLATSWKNIASDMSAGWKWYDVTFTLDASAGNSYQGSLNQGTEFLLYAVQPEGGAPTTVPYLTTW